jgi:succinoglycan biosynthesis transport protein ExoP
MLNALNDPQIVSRRVSFARTQSGVEAEQWTFGSLIGIVLRRINLVAVIAIAIVLLALFYLLLAEPRFTATAALLPDVKRTPPAPSELSQETLIDPAIVENQIETIRSERIALAVIDKLALWKDPEFVGKGPGMFARALSALNGAASSDAANQQIKRHAAADNFSRMLKVLRVGRSYLAEISFTSTDPIKAATIANEVADTYIQDQLGAKFSGAERSGRWMQQRIAELAQQVAAAAKAIEDYKAGSKLNFDANGRPAVIRTQEELTSTLEQAKAETVRINARAERVQATLHAEDRNVLPDSGFLDAADDATLARLRDEYRETLRAEPPKSLEDRGREPDDPALAAKLAEQRNAIWDAVHANSESVKTELEAARLREATIVRRIKEMAPEIEAAQQHLDKFSELDAKYRTFRQLHDALQNRYARVSQFVQQQSLPVTEARIVTEATPPLKKSSPKTTLILLLAAFAGGMLGIGSAIGLEYFDRTVRRAEQIEQNLGLRALGVVRRFGSQLTPAHSTSAETIDTRRAEVHPKESGNSAGSGSFLARKIDHWLAGAAGETLRGVKVAIDDCVRPAHGRVLAIVSPNIGEGKTTVALALAMLAARSGKRVLLIDADVREPSLTRALTPGLTGGFVVALGQQTPFADNGMRHELGFYFLGQAPGFTASHPSDILASDAMQNMLEHLRGRYDYVIVDTPALQPYVDVVASASLFDAFVLIAEWGRTTTDDINRSLNSSSALTERLVGVLIKKGPASKRWLGRLNSETTG